MHHLLTGEVVPLAPAIPAVFTGLAGLFTILMWVLALGLLLVWRHTIGAVFQHIANIFDSVSFHVFGHPIRPLGAFSASLREADLRVQQGLAATMRGCETAATALFHWTAALLHLTAQAVRLLAHDTELAFHALEHRRIPRMIGLALVPPLAALAAARKLAHVLQIELRHDAARFRAQIHRLAHATTVALPREIGRVGGRVGHLERSIAGTRGRLRRLERKLGASAFAGAVAISLGTLGLGFLRCPSFMRLGRRIGCGGFALLEDLLFGAVEVFAVSDLCRFAGLITATAEEIRPLLMDFVNAEEALVGCHGSTRPLRLSVPRVGLPPTNAGMSLAA